MTYPETLDYLFNSLPMFQRVGASAYKSDLNNTLALCKFLGNPERKFNSIHIAGTNGKGSTSHTLAAILQAAGYKTGLYTSPHLKSFTERIRLNGDEIAQDAVVQFVTENRDFLDDLKPSFFEMTVGMAFWYFAQQKVDIAVIEVGMGGRLDSTNVIIPELSIITNIGYDHMQFLGNTLPEIAGEKAGIIKPQIPVIISQTQADTTSVFLDKARQMNTPIVFADEKFAIKSLREKRSQDQILAEFEVSSKGKSEILEFGLLGNYQKYNLPGILEAVDELRNQGWKISEEAVKIGLAEVVVLTGLKGRWQILGENPTVIADTGHNEPGIREILAQLKNHTFTRLWMVIGMVQDKDISNILNLLPKEANYVFCNAQIPRAMPADQLAEMAFSLGLKGEIIPNVNDALNFARKNAGSDDLIFVGGSTFVVAEIDEL
ncbi:dihydrofolate synthase / folylpolyglutamate synthase [Algoriphagus alkaliphilus]|uniref:Dihydrofolate synthase/folylpolyglutamate synthase n=1 Tax=Algoriphagus alkaliphilus TaxID=279824 RepID=A0A1G5Z083_9BACT|nr:folylpolyglutamate synthase/dihydrofolate synthase family protein [Algoriphagus alkaliphilus]MBA4298618.1 bifunctional folylpolyglutamate synthase/dihydrofolate synthase [Cyclobacterium sp.]SDA88116.1 dihydrofolate synthase / folylpolyglutamate synthase [Algoriphagus alkaliphilus]